MSDIEVGAGCAEPKCSGTLQIKDVSEHCSCHINPPCQTCVEAPLECDECGEQPETG